MSHMYLRTSILDRMNRSARGLWNETRYIMRCRTRAGDAARYRSISALLVAGGVGVVLAALFGCQTSLRQAQPETPSARSSDSRAALGDPETVLNQYCAVCHNRSLNTGGVALDLLDVTEPNTDAEVWERVIGKLRTRAMPPAGSPRPDEATYDAVASWLEAEIDQAWAASPDPGRSNAVHRLNRTEYGNAIRDLFALDIDARSLLPGDETAGGSFDNFGDVLSVTTSHLERYLVVARKVTRLAVGLPPITPAVETSEVSLLLVQEDRQSEELPLGSRGGIAVHHHFPVDGEYLIKVRLRRQYQYYMIGMGWPQELDIRIDGELVRRFTVGGAGDTPAPMATTYYGDGSGPGTFGPPEWEEYMRTGDASLEVRVPVEAGPRVVSVAFLREMWEPEGIVQPRARGPTLRNEDRHMGYAAVQSVQIAGPYQTSGLAEDTPSRRAIFVCHPRLGAEEEACATEILSRMARRAYRRPVTEPEVRTLLEFFNMGREDSGSFDAGIQFALERLLIGPAFLLRTFRDPPDVAPGEVYHLSDLEIASRLSFFLWSSIPDETLLELAEAGQLTDPQILEQEVRRMLADPRATDAFVNDFVAQWLNLRRVADVLPDPDEYPNFDVNLLEAFERETALFVGSMLTEDRSVVDLLNADYTYVNERLALHYGIPGIYGSHFRRVTLPDTLQRGGLLAHGSVLALSSYPHRTSPVLRGVWLLENILGTPPNPPPPNVDTNLEPPPGIVPPSIRERLAQHRSSSVCAGCHSTIDPLGFALESFDALGGWRIADEVGNPIDATATMPDGTELEGLVGLRAVLLDRREAFVGNVTEKLMAYALGRALEYYDQPAVRQIVREAAAHDYRWSSIILGIVESPPFLLRRAAAPL